jgi:hypothetical protein
VEECWIIRNKEEEITKLEKRRRLMRSGKENLMEQKRNIIEKKTRRICFHRCLIGKEDISTRKCRQNFVDLTYVYCDSIVINFPSAKIKNFLFKSQAASTSRIFHHIPDIHRSAALYSSYCYFYDNSIRWMLKLFNATF